MGFAGKQGFSTIQVRLNEPTLVLTGGGGGIAKTAALANPTFTLS